MVAAEACLIVVWWWFFFSEGREGERGGEMGEGVAVGGG